MELDWNKGERKKRENKGEEKEIGRKKRKETWGKIEELENSNSEMPERR